MMSLSALKRVYATFVYNHRQEDVAQEGREPAPLAKALFHSEPSRAHPVIEPPAGSHAIEELTNDLDHILRHAKTGEYCPEERVRSTESYALVKVDEAYIQPNLYFRANFCSRRITNNVILVVERFDREPLRSSGRILTRSQYSLRRQAIILSSIWPACATSEMPM